MTQLPLFALVCGVLCVYDPHTVNGYAAPWRVDAPGGVARFGSLAGVRAWVERQERTR